MAHFLAHYYSPKDGGWDMESATKEEKEAGMKAWMDWKEKCGDAIVDFGAPLAPGKKVSCGDACECDKDCEKVLSGYSIVQADDMEAAMKLFEDHPHLAWQEGCEITLHESMSPDC